MEYRQRPNGTAGIISLGLRTRCDVSENSEGERTFSVPEDTDAGTHQRLIEAGHEPLEPGELPEGVTYDSEGGSSNGESGSSSGSDDGPTDGSSSSEESEETASGSESGSMTADRLTGEEEPPEPPEPLDEMNRSELYSYANEELGLDLQWSGDEALDEEEMRERIEEVAPDGE
jgi:hypothetical protein